MKLFARAAVVAVALLVALGAAEAQDDALRKDEALTKMVGTWQGKVDLRDEPDRTLVITSVVRERDQWIANLTYGPSGKTLSPVQGRIDRPQGAPVLTFAMSTTSKVELQLTSERELRGQLKVADGTGSWVSRKMLLKKTSEKP